MVMESAEALASIENSLRLIVRSVLGDEWTNGLGDDKIARLELKREEESARRDGAIVNADLLVYTEFYQLTKLVLDNWENFKPVFGDKKRTEVYFNLVEDVRNAIAHSRELLTFERELLSGITTQLRNQVAEYRAASDPASLHYPLIESITDSFGRSGNEAPFDPALKRPQLEVGDLLTFTARATDPRGRELRWTLGWGNSDLPPTAARPQFPGAADVVGNHVELSLTVAEMNVGESFFVSVFLLNSGRYHRHEFGDDWRFFQYRVNPPFD